MSVQQVQNFRSLRSLLKELRAFGLNPNQWRLDRRSQGSIASFTGNESFSIYFHRDPDFRMSGFWQKKITGQMMVSDLMVEAV